MAKRVKPVARSSELVVSTNIFPTPESRARWFFEFLRLDLSESTEGQLLGMRKDAAGFTAGEIELDDDVDQESGLPTTAALIAAQNNVRSGFERLHDGWWILDGPIKYG